ncbi:zinc ribbon domain-containing protein [Kineothrix sp. MB12-C1]|uniref:zinc ribbon domain-containing protein n=1 Tax=Kineothrix sp. MB12-C1 TaxID=3070215 RepID=UPI0027D2ADC9|nr:zinc ribbon domain-containing protein [Kineothrix sp. MB12-C1]WMC93220.1 zinc ribbon domain-containing protein [Kineothrix sp. MB12-C1]
MALIKCPECGKEISDQVSICPHCGYPLKKKTGFDLKHKKVVLLIGILLLIIATIFIYFKFMYRGSFDISQSNSNIELGAKTDLINYLEYNPENIIEVNIIGDNDFNINKIGDYSVLFSIKNKKGYIEEIPFQFHVVDTIAPKLSVKGDIVYLPKGNEYDPKDNTTVSDKDDYSVEIIGNYNLDETGTYDIFFVAKDKSGNVSDKKSMKLVVEDRDNCIVRNVRFGDSLEIIQRYEAANFLGEEYGDDGSHYIQYEDDVEGENALITYLTNNKDELCQVMFTFIENHTDYSLYLNYFNNVSEKISKEYGTPEVIKAKGSLYNYCDSEADALNIGQVKYRNTWETNDVSIYLYLAKDNYEMSFALLYISKTIEQPDDSKFN